MKTFFGAAMRKAAQLTRGQAVLEATQRIQRALSRPGGLSPSSEAPNENPSLTALVDRLAQGGRSALKAADLGRPQRGGAGKRAQAGPSKPSLEEAWLEEGLEVLRLVNFSRADARLEPATPSRKAPAEPREPLFASRAFAGESGSRDYKLFVPSSADGGKLPLIVMLHGCTQDPDDFARGTGMNLFAEDKRFIVAYPSQCKRANHSGCWNWFNSSDQMRDAGEPGILAGMTRSLMEEFDVDPARVYVAGLSAGGAMAAILSATYPELYAAAGIHSGLPYRSATDMGSAFAAMRGHANPTAYSPTGRPKTRAASRVRTIVFHGAADPTVHPSNAKLIVAAARVGLKGATQEEHEGRSVGGRKYTRTVISDANGVSHVEYWAIEGLGHAWSGGSPEGSYTDPKGPDASKEMLRFFFEKPAAKDRTKPHAEGGAARKPKTIQSGFEPA